MATQPRYYYTQFDNNKNTTPTDLVLGLDFGTSCSKVVIRSPFILGGMASAVHFGKFGHPGNQYLLPTRPFFNDLNKLELGHSLSKPQFPALKMRLVNQTNNETFGLETSPAKYSNIELAIGYIAETLRLSRKWFVDNKATVYGGAPIRWHFNLGIPSTGHKDELSVSLFRMIAQAGWNVSVLQEPVNLENCRKVIDALKNGAALADTASDRINIIPEVSAQVVGYSKSSVRRDGLHLLMDVGAGTVDISCFILEKDKHALLASSVERFGAFELHSQRIGEMKSRLSKWLEGCGKTEDPIRPMPEGPEKYLPSSADTSLTSAFAADSEMQKCVCKEVHKVLHDVRKRRDPSSPNWISGIATFLTGGGADAKVYGSILTEVHNWWSTSAGVYGLRKIGLGTPANLVAPNLPPDVYHRLSVAYGLSHTKDELGEIKPEFEIKDLVLPPTKPSSDDNFISKDQV